MLVIGIDPGIAITGFGLIRDNEQGAIQHCASGIIRTSAGESAEKRLLSLYNDIKQLLLLHRPESAGVEKLFFQHNVKTAMAVGEARGIILLALAELDIPLMEYTPNEVKQSITGYGAADKKQIQMMIKALLNLPELPKPDDVADALAIAICHINSHRTRQAMLEK
jgi:crossover junction endodeoxyribonuclease RuvC